MSAGQIASCLVFALLLAAGQILFKSAAMSMPAIRSFADLGAATNVPALWAAVVLYGGATLLWIYLLQTIPLSRAYPFAALGFVLVPAAGVLFFQEQVSGLYAAGAILIVVGLSLISQG